MQEKIEELEKFGEELSKENKNLIEKLANEAEKRNVIAAKLIELENDVIEKKNNDKPNEKNKDPFIRLLTEHDHNPKKKNIRKCFTQPETLMSEASIHEKKCGQAETFEKSLDYKDFLYFIQCEAAALENFLSEDNF